jgi:T cell receptor alpha chain V region
VEQHPSILSVKEGDRSVINCTYSDTASDYFLWYKQEPGKRPQLITDIRSNRVSNQKQRLLVLLNKKEKHISLHIEGTQPGDSAVYFCAVRAHCFLRTCNLSSNLPLGLQLYLCLLPQVFQCSICQMFICKWKLSSRH